MLASASRPSLGTARPSGPVRTISRNIAAKPDLKVYFGPFNVTQQVFLQTAYSFALVNIKPLLPGHVLVCPLTRHKRLTDLSAPEMSDLMRTVQKVQRLLAHHYFTPTNASDRAPLPTKHYVPGTRHAVPATPEEGSFNIAIQDGAEAGQTVPHVHVHVIPRIRDVSAKDTSGEGDTLYERMAEEEGNIGGALWDEEQDTPAGKRPAAGGKFARIEDSMRRNRELEDMLSEVKLYKSGLKELGLTY